MTLDPRAGEAGHIVQKAAPSPGSGEGPPISRAALRAAAAAIDRARTDWSRTVKAIGSLSRDRSLRSRDRRVASDLAWHVVRGRRLLELLLGHVDGAAPSESLVRGAAVLFADAPLDVAPPGARDAFEDPRHALFAHVWESSPTEAAALGLATSLPDWFAEQLIRSCDGLDDAIALARSLLGRAPLTLRVHRERLTRDALLEELQGAGVDAAASPVAPDAVVLSGRVNVHSLPAVQRGDVSVQDAGSQAIAQLVAPEDGEHLLDACAGAGGKTLALASLGPGARIVGCDGRAPALEQARKRARHAGVSDRIRFVPIPPDGSLPAAIGPSDAVLVDAPCTGSGSLRREPHARWSRSPLEIHKLPGLQGRILDRFAPFVKPGGRLVYATCSLFDTENMQVVNEFLGRNRSFLMSDGEPLRLRPDRDGCDGFFAAVLLRSI